MIHPTHDLTRRQVLAGLTGALPAVALAAPGGGSGKKGWAGGDAPCHRQFAANWYYTWTPHRPAPSPEFVPMIKGEAHLDKIPVIQDMPGITSLLGFNEPERAKQGNLSVDRAVELWPRLMALAQARNLRLGSPAPSSDPNGMAWLDAFMNQARRRNLRVDFVAVHWYRSRDPDRFEAFVGDLAKEYRRPVWITEFNGWTGPESDHYDFLRKSLRFLERAREVERYAYFEPGKGKPHSLFRADGTLSRLGELYRDAG